MSQLTLSTLLTQIGSDKVTGFFLVLARVSPLFVLAPLFSSKMVPVRVKGIVAVGLSIGLTPLAVHGQTIPTDPMALAGMLVVQVLVGLAFAFAIGMVLTAVEAAGAITDMVAGFSFGSVVDPINGNQGGTMTNLYSLVGLAMFIAVGGDAWTLRGLQKTFDLVPLTKARLLDDLRLRGGGVRPGHPRADDHRRGLRDDRQGRPPGEHLRRRLPHEGRRGHARRRRLPPLPGLVHE
jgi:flagellar biosynthetic protein FliR